MNEQTNLRLPEKVLTSAKSYAKEHGFSTIHKFIKEVIREKLFDESEISTKELGLVKKLFKASEKNNFYGTEEQLFNKLRKK